jgi:hypothetical protein
VIPEHLDTRLRNREGNALARVRDAIAAGRELRGRRDALRRIVDALRSGGAAMRGVHVHLERGLVGLQQLLVAFRELRRVLTLVRGGHRVQRLLVRVRIGVMLARPEVRDARLRGGSDASVPGRNRTIGIGGLLGAQRCELGAELRGVGS